MTCRTAPLITLQLDRPHPHVHIRLHSNIFGSCTYFTRQQSLGFAGFPLSSSRTSSLKRLPGFRWFLWFPWLRNRRNLKCIFIDVLFKLSIDHMRRVEHPSATGRSEALLPRWTGLLHIIRRVNRMKASPILSSLLSLW